MGESNRELKISALLEGNVRRLSHVKRYSSIPVIRSENVAEHTFYVCLYSYAIGKDLQRQGVKINMESLLERCLLHDIDESMTGDFLRIVKYTIPGLKELLDRASVEFVSQLSEEMGLGLAEIWREFKDDSIEGQILYIADLLCVVAYIIEEKNSGSHHMNPIFREVHGYFQDLVAGRTKYNPSKELQPYIAEITMILQDHISHIERS